MDNILSGSRAGTAVFNVEGRKEYIMYSTCNYIFENTFNKLNSIKFYIIYLCTFPKSQRIMIL